MPKPKTTDGKDCSAERRRAVEEFLKRQAGWRPVVFSVEEIPKSRHEGHRF